MKEGELEIKIRESPFTITKESIENFIEEARSNKEKIEEILRTPDLYPVERERHEIMYNRLNNFLDYTSKRSLGDIFYLTQVIYSKFQELVHSGYDIDGAIMILYQFFREEFPDENIEILNMMIESNKDWGYLFGQRILKLRKQIEELLKY